MAYYEYPKRIEHVEIFLGKMKLQRNEMVKLLMWEIGKSLIDSEKNLTGPVSTLKRQLGN